MVRNAQQMDTAIDQLTKDVVGLKQAIKELVDARAFARIDTLDASVVDITDRLGNTTAAIE